MPSFFFRQRTKQWYVQIGWRQAPLGRDNEAAKARYHALMLDPSEVDPPIADVAEAFLEWSEKNRDPATYDYYARFIRSFVREVVEVRFTAQRKRQRDRRCIRATQPIVRLGERGLPPSLRGGRPMDRRDGPWRRALYRCTGVIVRARAGPWDPPRDLGGASAPAEVRRRFERPHRGFELHFAAAQRSICSRTKSAGRNSCSSRPRELL